MSELQPRLERLVLRLDRMGMRAEQALADALQAVRDGNVAAGQAVDDRDAVIDREEVEIEQECVRLLALYQPAAVDLRMICTVIKVNNDLERIADLAAGMGRRVKHVVGDGISPGEHELFGELARRTTDILGKAVRLINARDATAAHSVIGLDRSVNAAYGDLVRFVLQRQGRRLGGAEPAMTIISLAKSLERIGDLCTNIAEDIIFLRTGDIVRHAGAFKGEPAGDAS